MSTSSTKPKLGVGEFFALLRSHVPPQRLQALLSSLAAFNAKTLPASQLMTTAKQVLAGITPEELEANGLSKAPVDLLFAFESYMRK